MGARGMWRRIGTSALGIATVAGGVVVVSGSPAAADVALTNATPVTIPDVAPASVYPTTINVPAGNGTVTDVNVTLHNLSHTFSADLDVQLVSPLGTSVTLLGDAAGGSDYVGADITFDDEAASPVFGSPIPTGVYQPSGFGGQSFPPPAVPATSGGTSLSAFDGQSPTGVWSLYIVDDLGGDVGSMAGGWTLSLSGATVIDTRPSVNATVGSFGVPDTSVYGQVITVPAGATFLSSFGFQMNPSNPVTFRGAVYAWDSVNHRATGPALYVGPPQSTPVGSMNDVAFVTPGVPVTPGAEYVILATTTLDDGQSSTLASWSSTPGAAYPGGSFVFLNAGADESLLTTSTWSNQSIDLGFVVGFDEGLVAPSESGVTVSATTPTAVEGGVPGVFTFARTGDTSASLTIGYQVSGSADAGTDYEPFGIVTFNAGETSVAKSVVAAADGVAEPDETVLVSLQPGGYTVGSPSQATVTITDEGAAPPPTDPCADVDDPGFTDVPADNVHLANITCLAGLGLAQGGPGGIPADQYGPRQQTTRGQIASFLARLLEAGGATLPAAPADAFADDDDSVHELRINQLAELGVIAGNGETGSSYRPGDDITREEMASLVLNTINQLATVALESTENAFTDDDDSPYEDAINALAKAEIVEGVGGGLYDPDGTVQRDSMASFLVRSIQYLAELGDFGAPAP